MAGTLYSVFLPRVLQWVQETLDAYDVQKRSVKSFGFRRLPLYFDLTFLQSVRVVVTDHLPIPPLSAWGLAEFASMEFQPQAVTYQDTYFLEANAASSESLHFHELVHAVQWRVLGPEDFLLMYAAGLAEHGYEDSPLEVMAREHEARFEAGELPYSVEAEVCAQTCALLR